MFYNYDQMLYIFIHIKIIFLEFYIILFTINIFNSNIFWEFVILLLYQHTLSDKLFNT